MRPAGLNITLVTYKGTGPVVTDLLGAHIPLGIIDIHAFLSHFYIYGNCGGAIRFFVACSKA